MDRIFTMKKNNDYLNNGTDNLFKLSNEQIHNIMENFDSNNISANNSMKNNIITAIILIIIIALLIFYLWFKKICRQLLFKQKI